MQKEKLVSIQSTVRTRAMLREISKKERRSMSGALELMIEDKYKKIFHNISNIGKG